MDVSVKVVEKVSLEDEAPLSPGGVPRGTGSRLPHDALLVRSASQPQLSVRRLQVAKRINSEFLKNHAE